MDEIPVKQPQARWVIGLTGGIGSGKSTVANMLRLLGAHIIDADAISRASTAAGGIGIQAIQTTFGADFITPDGAMDRERMRALVFSDASAKQRLESVLHPLIRAEIGRQLASAPHGVVVLDVPLLAESRTWQEGCDQIWVVDCTPETQIQRVVHRNGWTPAQVEAVLAAQATRIQRLAIANTVILNDGLTLSALQKKVAQHWRLLQQQVKQLGTMQPCRQSA